MRAAARGSVIGIWNCGERGKGRRGVKGNEGVVGAEMDGATEAGTGGGREKREGCNGH